MQKCFSLYTGGEDYRERANKIAKSAVQSPSPTKKPAYNNTTATSTEKAEKPQSAMTKSEIPAPEFLHDRAKVLDSYDDTIADVMLRVFGKKAEGAAKEKRNASLKASRTKSIIKKSVRTAQAKVAKLKSSLPIDPKNAVIIKVGIDSVLFPVEDAKTTPGDTPSTLTASEGSPKSPTSPGTEVSPGGTFGPRIKHVCRRAAVALGKKPATFPKHPQLRLSALPLYDKARLLRQNDGGNYSVVIYYLLGSLPKYIMK
jgi:hypothetical protein